MASRNEQRPAQGQPAAHPEKPSQFEIDRIAAALCQLYGRIAAEPLPRRFIELVNRLKLRH